jgi:hypothetical protein
MQRAILSYLIAQLLFGGAYNWAAEPAETEEQARKALTRAGVEIVVNQQDPARPVIHVVFGSESKATDADLAHLRTFRSLTRLVVVSNEVTDAGLLHLKDLTGLKSVYLGVYSGLCPITDKGLEPLRSLTNLEELTLRNTHMTGAAIWQLEQKLPKVLARQREETLARLKSKRMNVELDTGCGKIIGTSMSCHSDPFTDLDLPCLRYLPSLEKLSLGSDITNAGLPHLKWLTNLRTLEICSDRVTDAGIRELQKALPRTKINYMKK